jgi:putative addiction module killer protein
MFKVAETSEFSDWLEAFRDTTAQIQIATRISRAQDGNLGDVKFFDGIGEMRIDYGPGDRVYFVRRGTALVVLLCGGDKDSQRKDVKRALVLATGV